MLQFILVAMGKQKLSDYLVHRNTVKAIEAQGNNTALQIEVSQRDQQRAMEAGFGAIGDKLSHEVGTLTHTIELSLDKVANGMNTLNANFNLLMGDVIWHIQMQQEISKTLLQEVRIPEFVREAREYRSRGERSYKKKWFDRALKDFLDAEECNYEEFSVYPLIASIYFYEEQDLPKALEYFVKGAKYSREHNESFSAECHYFAGMVLAAQQQHKESLEELRKAVELNPNFFEAHYWCACMASLINDESAALDSLETAIKGDPKYHARAKGDPAFDNIRPQVQTFLDRIIKESVENVLKESEKVSLVITFAEAIVESKSILKYRRANNELPGKASQDNYETNVALIYDAQNLRNEMIQFVEPALEKQIERKRKQIKDKEYDIDLSMLPIKHLETRKAAITDNFQEWEAQNQDLKSCSRYLFGCGSVIGFVIATIVLGVIVGMVKGDNTQDIVSLILTFLGIVSFSVLLWLAPNWFWELIEEYKYKRSVITPTKEIQKSLSYEKREIKQIKEKLSKELTLLKSQLEDLEKKVKMAAQLR